MRNIRLSLSLVAISALASACGTGTSEDSPSAQLSSGTGFTGGGDTFFNDVDGIKFADSIGGSFNTILDAVFSGFDQDTSIASGTFTQRMRRAAQTETTQCESSGSITVISTINDSTQELSGISMNFNNCVSGSSQTNGGLSLALSGSEPNITVAVSFNNFNTIENGDTSSLDGEISISVSESGSQINTTISGSSFTLASAGETVSFTNYTLNSVVNDITDAASISGGATIVTGAGSLSMSINPALSTNGEDDYPTTGIIEWMHTDGSSLLIDADTGDVNTFSYSVSDGAAVSSGVSNWSDTDVSGISM